MLKKKEKLLTNVKFSYMNSDPLLPIIILNPILNGRVSTYTVKLYPYISGGMFKVTKLAPDRNNVRDTSAGEGQGQCDNDKAGIFLEINLGRGTNQDFQKYRGGGLFN